MKNTLKIKIPSLEMVLLKILSTDDCYGYQIAQTVEKLSDGLITISLGTMYPALYRLQEKGFISDYKKIVAVQMERVYYHLEKSGLDELNRLQEEYKKMTAATMNILNYEGESAKEQELA